MTAPILQARLVGRDIDNDIALLKVTTSAEDLPSAQLAASDDLILAEPTIALGNPFGLGGSVTDGILSATARSINFRGRELFSDFLQTSAVINPGNSGGPLLNIHGDVIGINIAIHSREAPASDSRSPSSEYGRSCTSFSIRE